MVHAAGVALVLPAELTLGIAALRGALGGGDGLGVLLRLGEVDGDVQVAVFCPRHPFDVFRNAVAADIVCVAAKFIIKFRGFFRTLPVKFPKPTNHHAGSGNQSTHKLRVKEVPVNHAIFFQNSLSIGPVQQSRQNVLQGHAGSLGILLIFIQDFQQSVDRVYLILLRHQSIFHAIGNQFPDQCIHFVSVLFIHDVSVLFIHDVNGFFIHIFHSHFLPSQI